MTAFESLRGSLHELGSRQSRPYIALLLAISFISLSAIFTRWAGVPGAASGFWRMAFPSL